MMEKCSFPSTPQSCPHYVATIPISFEKKVFDLYHGTAVSSSPSNGSDVKNRADTSHLQA